MIGKACKEAKVLRLIHVSALGADHNSPSEFLRAKVKFFYLFEVHSIINSLYYMIGCW